MKNLSPLDIWFTDITVRQKEHIAAKILQHEGGDIYQCRYPNCWNVWRDLPADRKQQIRDHCTDRHGIWVAPLNETPTLGHDF